MKQRTVVWGFVFISATCACSGSGRSSTPTEEGGAGNGGGGASAGGGSGYAVELPAANASFDYQIGGAYVPSVGVSVVSRDRGSAPATGLYNICYVNGFQAQPSEDGFWRSEHPELILQDASGSEVTDENWGELLLDTRTVENRTKLGAIVGAWIAKCRTDGFSAVEIDNLDSYNRSKGLLTADDNVALMKLFSAVAHARGLAIAQKNSPELLTRVSELGTDFAVAEDCNRWDECSDYQAAYGDLVFIIEYRQVDFAKGCQAFPELSIVLRDLDVSTPASGSYVYAGC